MENVEQHDVVEAGVRQTSAIGNKVTLPHLDVSQTSRFRTGRRRGNHISLNVKRMDSALRNPRPPGS